MFVFLCQKYNSRMAFDPTYPTINMSELNECKWKYFCGKLEESIPPNASEKRGKEVDLCVYVDRYHAG